MASIWQAFASTLSLPYPCQPLARYGSNTAQRYGKSDKHGIIPEEYQNVYHQFVLTLLYFFTPFVSFVHPLVVPWLGFAIIMTVSLLLTWLTLKSKTGRLLIG